MGGIGAQRQRALILLVSAVGCAAPASEGPRRLELAPAAPTLASHRLVAEGETGPSRAELRPYIRQVPLVRIVQDGFVTYRDPSYDLAVFAHGSLFFEGEHRVAEIGFRAGRLDADTLRVLREELGKLCPVLEVGPFCTDSMSVSVACHLPSGDFSGRDHCPSGEGDRHTIDAAKTVIDSLRIGSWVASDPRGTRTYLAGDIEKTLRPIRWKRYVPIGEQSPPDAPGPARSLERPSATTVEEKLSKVIGPV